MAQIIEVLLKLKDVCDYPFSTVTQALNRYNLNPARAKYVNFFEPEQRGKPYYQDFDKSHPDRVWSRIVRGIFNVLRGYRPEQRAVWWICSIGDRTKQLHPNDVRDRLKISKRTIYRWLEQINDDIEQEFIRRKLIPNDRENERTN